MTSAWGFTNAFKKNCPGVRMTNDEGDELARLFFECQKEARQKGFDEAVQQQKQGAARAQGETDDAARN